MHRLRALLILLCLGLPGTTMAETAWDFRFDAIDGEPLPLSTFQGKALLVVNTASQCGYTPQYADLVTVWRQYRDRGLVVLGVPSNDFGGQEPGSAQQIKQFCEVNYDVDFPLTAKSVVSGADAHPLYRWLATELGTQSTPRWNFHKYVIGADGRPIAAFPSQVKPTDAKLIAAIEQALPK
jgi:glutathione peroxidase